MNTRKLFGDILYAFAAQGVSFLCSVLMTLLVPKILGVEDFGYWQLFIFYSSYVSFFQLGLNDGVYLQQGGMERDKIDKTLMKSEFLVGFAYQLLIACSIVFYALAFGDQQDRTFVVCSAGVFLLISNLSYFVSYVLQSMNETRLSSLSGIVDRCVFIVPLGLCVIFQVGNFRVYIVAYVVARLAALLFSLWSVRDFFSVETLSFGVSLKKTFESMKVGIVLTAANVSGMLIVGAARFAIDAIWGVEVFGEVSLSLSLVNFALAFISQVAMVLFPAFRTVDPERLSNYYELMRDVLSSILPYVFLAYIPVRFLVGWWLPQYDSSLAYLAYLLPVCIFEMQTNLTVATFLKVRNEARTLLLVNIAALAVAVASISFASLVVSDPHSVIAAAVVSIAVRWVVGSMYLTRVYSSGFSVPGLSMALATFACSSACVYCDYLPGFALCSAFLLLHGVACRKNLLVAFNMARQKLLDRNDGNN